jgi:(2R)-sulfolactate sulfo-lyase subunit alpha
MESSPVKPDMQEQVRAEAGAPHFLAHNEGDHVAVAVQDVERGPARVSYMDSERSLELDVHEPVPLGHKVALEDLAAGAEVIEYQVKIGVTRRSIRKGEYVHVHNIRSARWERSE